MQNRLTAPQLNMNTLLKLTKSETYSIMCEKFATDAILYRIVSERNIRVKIFAAAIASTLKKLKQTIYVCTSLVGL
jgi:hypothetical protein